MILQFLTFGRYSSSAMPNPYFQSTLAICRYRRHFVTIGVVVRRRNVKEMTVQRGVRGAARGPDGK